MKRSLLFVPARASALVLAGTCLVAGTYGLVRLAYGLFLPDIAASVSLGTAAAGYISTGASVAYCAGALAGFVAADRPRALVVGAASSAALGSLGMAAATTASTFAPCAVVASVGAGLASPGLVAILDRNLPSRGLDRAQATVNAGTGPGLVAAGVMALLLTQWRAGFVISASFTAAAGVGVLLLDRRGERPVDRAPGSAGTSRGWWTALAVPATAALLLGAASAAVWTFGRSHLVAAGASADGSVVAWIALGVGGTATVLTARSLSTVPAAHSWAVSTWTVAAAVAALGAAPDRFAVAVTACALFGWGFVAASSALIAWTGELAPRHAAAGTSLLFVALVLGQGAGSAGSGALADRMGLPAAFLLAAAVAGLAASCSLLPGRGGRPGAGACADAAAGPCCCHVRNPPHAAVRPPEVRRGRRPDPGGVPAADQ